MPVVGDTAVNRAGEAVWDTEWGISRVKRGLFYWVLLPSLRDGVVLSVTRAREVLRSSFRGGALLSPGPSFCFRGGNISGPSGVLFRAARTQNKILLGPCFLFVFLQSDVFDSASFAPSVVKFFSFRTNGV